MNGNAVDPPTNANASEAVPANDPVNPPAVNCPKTQALVVLEFPITVVLDPNPIALLPIMISLMSPLADVLMLVPITIELLILVTGLPILSKLAAL